jgi:drug/metabolite transporter (DMT)-like permease
VNRVANRRAGIGATAVSLAALMFGLNASTVKVILATGISPELLVLFRATFTAVVAGFILLLTNRKAFKVAKKDIPLLIVYGIIGIAMMQWSYSNAVSRLPIAVALLIEYTAIVIVPLVALILFKEKIKARLWVGIAAVLVGLGIVSNIWDSHLDPIGVAWAVMAAICVSVYFLIGEHTQRKRDAMSTLFYTFAIAAVFWAIINIINPSNIPDINKIVSLSGNLADVMWPTWVALLWLGIMGSFVPMLLDYIALGNLSATAVGIIATAETVFASAFAWVWLGESMTTLGVIGGLIVVAGIVLAETSRTNTLKA